MLRGRLGMETARIPHADRHGLLWLSRGALTVRDELFGSNVMADQARTVRWRRASTAFPFRRSP